MFCGPLGPVFTSHSPLLFFLLIFSDAVQQAAGDEGHGHEEDDGWAHDGGQDGHAEPKVLITRESWRAREGHRLIYGCYCQVTPRQVQTFVILQHQKRINLCWWRSFSTSECTNPSSLWWLILKKKSFTSISRLCALKARLPLLNLRRSSKASLSLKLCTTFSRHFEPQILVQSSKPSQVFM